MSHSPPSPVFLNLAEVIRALRVAVAAWGGRGVLGTVLLFVLYRRIGEIGRRMAGIAARFQAGRVRRRSVPVRGEAAVAVRRASGPRVWPRRFGWLVQRVGFEAAGFGCQLRAVLETPEMVALLAASPEAGRVLRPLCRALAIETSVPRPGRDGAAVAVPEAAAVRRVRAPRVRPDLGRVPIPRGVMAAVRRRGLADGV